MDLSEYVVSGRGTPDSGELAEFEVQMQEFVPSNSAAAGAGADDSQWVRSCVELAGYARGWVPRVFSLALNHAVHYDAGGHVLSGPGDSWQSVH